MRNWEMSRNKLIFLSLALFLSSFLLVLYTHYAHHSSHKLLCSQKPTMASNFLYRALNFTYLEDMNDPQMKMDDPKLISAIRHYFLRPPSLHIVPYKLKEPNLVGTGQAKAIINILRGQMNGFFVEAGALDGESSSNTLFLESELNWSGLLIEPDPIKFAKMMEKNRKAWLSHSCLSTLPYPRVVSFKQAFNVGRISLFRAGYVGQHFVEVQCLPLYSLLLALNRTTVDYLSLDVEGDELDVLRTIPFSDLNIRTLSVEYLHVPEGTNTLVEYMQMQGYDLYATVVHPDNLANDFVFVLRGGVP